MSRLFLIVALVTAFFAFESTAGAQSSMAGSYNISNLDGTNPYPGWQIGVDVVDMGDGLYMTWGWAEQNGVRTYAESHGWLSMHCEDGGDLISSSKGYSGQLYHDSNLGGYVADYSAVGGNTRLWVLR